MKPARAPTGARHHHWTNPGLTLEGRKYSPTPRRKAESILLPPVKIATSALKTILATDKAPPTAVSTNFQAAMTTRMLLISGLSKLSGDNINCDKFFEVRVVHDGGQLHTQASQSAGGNIFQHTIINAMNTRCVSMGFDMHSHQFKDG